MIEVRQGNRSGNKRKQRFIEVEPNGNTNGNTWKQDAILGETERKHARNKHLSAPPERLETGRDPLGSPCFQSQRLGGVDLVRAGQMLRILNDINAKGFDGEILLAEIEKATLGKPHDPALILAETERCGTWCGVLSGRELTAKAIEVFK